MTFLPAEVMADERILNFTAVQHTALCPISYGTALYYIALNFTGPYCN